MSSRGLRQENQLTSSRALSVGDANQVETRRQPRDLHLVRSGAKLATFSGPYLSPREVDDLDADGAGPRQRERNGRRPIRRIGEAFQWGKRGTAIVDAELDRGGRNV